ncbi:hypothetical protein [uncultured Tateyamaria sp.]|uniref:hypothetical protein n=1 Tax=Tateyamaria sp. 1078 TaxID=3417464 RepID=UPI00260A635E|nr:hypothetical protein [uncultured Tateyamaria sp.]
MSRLKTAATGIATALFLTLPAGMAAAELSQSDIATITGQSGLRVVTSDGDFVGVSNGVRVGSRHTRLFLFNRTGSVFRFRGRDVVITTSADQLSLRDGVLVLDATTQRLRNKAQTPASDSSGPITIFLPRR